MNFFRLAACESEKVHFGRVSSFEGCLPKLRSLKAATLHTSLLPCQFRSSSGLSLPVSQQCVDNERGHHYSAYALCDPLTISCTSGSHQSRTSMLLAVYLQSIELH